MHFCPYCGKPLASHSKFCEHCGRNLNEKEGTVPVLTQSSKTHPAVWVLLSLFIGFFAVGMIAILASIVIVAINPSKQLAMARNAQRRADINVIVNAVYLYGIEHNKLPDALPKTPLEICRSESTDCTGLVDLEVLVGTYLGAIPHDPATEDSRSTHYTIYSDQQGNVTVSAPNAEGGEVISVAR